MPSPVSAAEGNAAKRVGTLTRVGFGIGTISDGVKLTTFNTFLLFFYTQVVGLSPSLAGTSILLALVVDAISDPLVGNLSDHFHSRWGRRHPFIYLAPLPTALCFVALLAPPESLSETGQFLWMTAFAIGVRISITFYSVPSASLVPEMTQNYDERTSLLSYRVMAGWLGGILMAQLGYLVFFAPTEGFPDGRLNRAAYFDYAVTGAVIMVAAILVCGTSTHKLIPHLHRPPPGPVFSAARFGRELIEVFSNRTYVVLVVAILIAATAVGFTDAMGLYINTYFWGLSTEQLAITLGGAALGAVLASVLTPSLANRSDKRTLALRTVGVIVFCGPLPVLLRLIGLMPANGSTELLVIITLHTTLIVFVAVAIMIIVGSMIADITDQHELNTGKRQEGMFNASFALMSKATSGIGGFLAGLILELVSFPSGALPGEVPQETLNALGIAFGPGIFLIWLTALVFLFRYRLDRAEHLRIIAALEDRRGALGSV